jgi:hypothetical protein
MEIWVWGSIAPGRMYFPFGIDDVIGPIIQIRADGLDFVSIGKYIGQIATRSVYDGSALK